LMGYRYEGEELIDLPQGWY